jgi:broad specificity phosphatase PhoE
MKTIELRRHSLKTGPGQSNLSPAGIELAEQLGATELRGQAFTHLFVSTLKRTSDTLEAMRRGAGDFPDIQPEIFPPHRITSRSEYMPLWEGPCYQAELAHQDMLLAVLKEQPELAGRVATQSSEVFRIWLNELPDNAHALVIDHSPALELIAYGLLGVTIPQLQTCEGFIITEKDGELSLETLQ